MTVLLNLSASFPNVKPAVRPLEGGKGYMTHVILPGEEIGKLFPFFEGL